jgi:hypothetical protein
MARAGGRLNAVRDAKQQRTQSQMMEMMKAGFQPVSPQPGAQAGGGAGMGDILQRMARALGGPRRPQQFQMAPWHQSEQARKQRAHEIAGQTSAQNAAVTMEQARADSAKEEGRRQFNYEKVLSEDKNELTVRLAVIDSADKQYDRKFNYADLEFRKGAEEDRVKLDAELGRRGLDIKNADVFYHRDDGKYFISDVGGNLFVLDTKGGGIEEVTNTGTGQIDEAQARSAASSWLAQLLQMKQAGLDVDDQDILDAVEAARPPGLGKTAVQGGTPQDSIQGAIDGNTNAYGQRVQ